MVSGLEFLRMACQSTQPQPQSSRFNPSVDDAQNVSNLGFGSTVEFQRFGDSPRPAPRPGTEVYHPRPVREIELKDALHRFEEMAWSIDRMTATPNEGSSSNGNSMLPTASLRYPNPLALSPDEYSTLPISERAIEPPKRTSGQRHFHMHERVYPAPIVCVGASIWAPCPEGQWPSRMRSGKTYTPDNDDACLTKVSPAPPQSNPVVIGKFGGLLCLSPDQLADHRYDQDAALRTQDPPSPTVVPSSPSEQKASPVPSSISRVQSQYTNSNATEERGDLTNGANADDDDELEYISNFDEENDGEEDNRLNFLTMLDSDSDAVEEDEAYYTASEYSEYSDYEDSDTDWLGNKDGTASEDVSLSSISHSYERPRGRRRFPPPGLQVFFASTSPLESTVSTNSATRPTQLPPGAANSLPPHLRWMKGLLGDDVSFLLAAERALQR